MSFIRRHKTGITAVLCVIAVLAVAFFCGVEKNEAAPGDSINDIPMEEVQLENQAASVHETVEKNEEAEPIINKPVSSPTPEEEHNEIPEKVESVQKEDKESEEKEVAENKTPEAVTEETVKSNASNNELTCTLSVRCDNAIGKTEEKQGVVPQDGIIFSEQRVVFYPGESVFNVLQREMKKNNIHMEFVSVPLYNSAYIEGIANLYEFDCGELSGWMYKVNDWFPNYGCSSYQLKDGDRVEFVYTCDLGADVGGSYSARNGR